MLRNKAQLRKNVNKPSNKEKACSSATPFAKFYDRIKRYPLNEPSRAPAHSKEGQRIAASNGNKKKKRKKRQGEAWNVFVEYHRSEIQNLGPTVQRVPQKCAETHFPCAKGQQAPSQPSIPLAQYSQDLQNVISSTESMHLPHYRHLILIFIIELGHA